MAEKDNWRIKRTFLKLTFFCWIVAAAILAIMIYSWPSAWDAKVYLSAIHALQRGDDAYAVGLAAQKEFHESAHDLSAPHPFSYVYSPVTLLLLRPLAIFPDWLLAALFLPAVIAGFLLTLWVGFQMANEEERPWLALMLPFVVFFPGLLHHEANLSCNFVYILYGSIFGAALAGWRHNKWIWFYLTILVASVFKPPLQTLLVLPLLVGKRQWLSAGLTGFVGAGMFALQPGLWPELFREYMLAVRLQFDWNGDFGFGPAGILGNILWQRGIPYHSLSILLYVLFACMIVLILLSLAHRVRQGRFVRELWIPVAFLGAFLLNPRIKEYDVAVITVPMLLIAWRILKYLVNLPAGLRPEGRVNESILWQKLPNPALFLAWSGWFTAFNIIGGEYWWEATELGMMLGLFAMGIGSLYCHSRETRGQT